ncbi:MAG: hypothetical protein BGO90_13865 [Legionella sp. 40-6]|nr:DUF3416 domain-containing protein [Legionella sp.]OJY18178.1 MAG: hypothetical protein BGO90_13865 [Legionella sp. 40-6]
MDHQLIFLKNNGLKRVWIDNLSPAIGNYALKKIVDTEFHLEVDIYADSIDEIEAVCHYKHVEDTQWCECPVTFLENDRWCAQFPLEKLGEYVFKIRAWINDFATWKTRFLKKYSVKEDYEIEVITGLHLLEHILPTNHSLHQKIKEIAHNKDAEKLLQLLESSVLKNLISKNYHPHYVTESEEKRIVVDRKRAQFSTWYELFPRSTHPHKKLTGTLSTLIAKLPSIKAMGFDVIYLPPIHPIGTKNRKGKNNAAEAMPNDPGSPWAIGNIEGGHTAIHPQLGTVDDFKNLVHACAKLDMEIALDFALQCSPDHPYLQDHPEWFKKRPDGTLQYAENPPKKYQDIYPFHFAAAQWPQMWDEFKAIIDYWVDLGVNIFRVDNPHTKPFIFWQWLIQSIKSKNPEVLFLAEAFTRPRPMYQLAKCGFNQSYTYFSWRNTKQEITEYLEELIAPPVCYFFRPNFWPNTPDILPEYLQKGGKMAHMIRLTLAATLSSNYGIYGPVFEHYEAEPLHEGSEEYLDSEKYEIKHWQNKEDSLEQYIGLINKIRHEHTAFHNTHLLQFLNTDNDQIISFCKSSEEDDNQIMVVINLDYQYKQSAMVTIDSTTDLPQQFKIKDLLNEAVYEWHQGLCYVELDPQKNQCAHIFQVIRDE